MASLLGPHTDTSMRPNTDKEIEAVDLDQLFDQYVETDVLHQLNNNTAEPSSSDDLAHLFELSSSNGSDPFDTKPLPNWDATDDDAWRKAIQTLGQEQNPASPPLNPNSPSIYPKSRGKASLSDPHLFNSDDLFEWERTDPRAVSQPSTPQPQLARPAKKARLIPHRTARHGVLKSSKQISISNIIDNIAGKMMRPSHYRTGFQDIWSRKMDGMADTFNLHMPHTGLRSPPPTNKLPHNENSNGFFHREQQPYTIAMSPLAGDDTTSSEIHHSNYQLTPLSSPAIDTSSRHGNAGSFHFTDDSMATAYISHHNSSAALSALQTPPPTNRLPINTWGSETSPNLDFSSFSASPDFPSQNTKSNGWWDGANSGQPATTPTYHNTHSRSSSQNVNFSSASVAGLGISCDTASISGFGNEMAGTSTGMNSSASFDMPPYASLYAPTTPGIPIGTTPANPHSRSPSLSPQPQQPRFTRRRHSSHQNPHHHAQQRHSRRKSSNSSNNSASNRPGSANVGFVNFTPDDSRKILTGVAPSGSSKTKARREKEAAEKRRKLSQAAVKAVMEAGGDVARLEQEGLLVLES